MNPILNQMQIGKINPQQIKQIWNNLKSMNNPQMLLNQMANDNPQISALLKYNNAKDAFYGLAKEKGIDPDLILNMLK